MPNLAATQLGTNQAAGFGWKDMTVFKFDTQWKPDKDWIVRVGFSHALTKEDDVNFAFIYSLSKTVSGVNPLSPSQTIELEMNQFSFQLGWTR